MAERPMLFSGPMVRAILSGTKTQTRRAVKGAPDDWAPMQPQTFWPTIIRRGVEEPGHQTYGAGNEDGDCWITCPYGKPGDRLWVRETSFAWGRWETRFSPKKGRDEWHFIDMTSECDRHYLYAADGVTDTQAFIKRRSSVTPMYWKRPAIHVPRVASRITLEITGVRVERLQDITEADALAEGIGLHVRGGWHWHKHDPLDLDDWHQFGFKTPQLAFESLWRMVNDAETWDANPWVWVVEFRRITP